MDEFLTFLFDKSGYENHKFKFILTHDDYDTMTWKGYVGFGSPNVYLKPLNNMCKNWIDAYDARKTITLDVLKEKLVCNDDKSYIIVKCYICHDENDIFLLYQVWPWSLYLNYFVMWCLLQKGWN